MKSYTKKKRVYILIVLYNFFFLIDIILWEKIEKSLRSKVRFGSWRTDKPVEFTFNTYPNVPLSGIVFPQISDQENVFR